MDPIAETLKILGPGNYALSGASVDGIGDVNGDGTDDVVIGAPGGYYQQDYEYGRVYVLYGAGPLAPSGPRSVSLPPGGGTFEAVVDGIDLVVRRQAAEELFRRPLDAVTALTVDGANDAETIIVDLTGGTPPAGFELTINAAGGDDILDASAMTTGVTLNGGAGNDSLTGSSAADQLSGDADNDWINARGGDDTLSGGTGDDLLFGGGEGDRLNGGEGNDLVSGQGGNDTLSGGAGTDTLNGGDERDYLEESNFPSVVLTSDQLVGDDTDQLVSIERARLAADDNSRILDARGFSGNVTLMGGSGNDSLYGTDTDDLLLGGGGDDRLKGGNGNDSLAGGEGNDHLNGQRGRDSIEGGGGADKLFGGAGRDWLDGGAGNDRLRGQGGRDSLRGADGDDRLFGGGLDTVVEWGDNDFTLSDTQLIGRGIDVLAGIEAAHLTGGSGDNTLDARGFSGPVTLAGGTGADTLLGGDGDDFLFGGAGNDRLNGGAGNDILHGAADDDGLAGGAGDDRLSGNAGADTLLGDLGNDSLFGGGGNDVVLGEAGIDKVDGQGGTDTVAGGGNTTPADPSDTITGETIDDDFLFDAPWVNV